MATQEKNTKLEEIANLLKGAVTELADKGSFVYSQDAELKEKDLIEYDSRMRVSGMEKFNNPCYIATVSFYRSAADQKSRKAIGSFALYLERERAQKTLKAFGYPVSLDADDAVVSQAAVTFCGDIARKFKEKLTSKGYSDLIQSDVAGHENTVSEGLEFDYGQYRYYELSFFAWKEKNIVIDLTFAPR